MERKRYTESYKIQKKAKKTILLGVLSPLLTGAITGLPAVIIGHFALSEQKRGIAIYSRTERRMIFGGIFLGYIGIILSIYLLIFVLAIFFEWDISEFITISN